MADPLSSVKEDTAGKAVSSDIRTRQTADPPAENESERIYFPVLDGLRFIAAFSVVIHHVEEFKHVSNHASAIGNYTIFMMGPKAVELFFVLSGFLITYLLMAEQATTGDINIRKFYVRRILRIWPLYFFVISLGFFVVPFFLTFPNYPLLMAGREKLFASFWQQAALFYMFLPNLSLRLFGPIMCIAPCWSIGVEEQFYLIWPGLLRRFKRHVAQVMMSVVALHAVAAYLLAGFDENIATAGAARQQLSAVLNWLAGLLPETMAIGGLAALVLYRKHWLATACTHPLGKVVTAAAIYAVLTVPSLPLGHTIAPFAFASLILNLAGVRRIGSGSARLVAYLGNISYGMYMLHSFAICIGLKLLDLIHLDDKQNFLAYDLALYAIAISGTMVFSSISYRWLEKPFLRMKSKFMTVSSGRSEQP